MIEYIYFVKCPNCDDEPFDFFDAAKEFAMGCLSEKPIITQVEVCRNDFGECTDSHDLGTIWSWEDMIKDVSTDESAVSIFTQGDFDKYNPDKDSEFDSLDNSVDFEVEEVLKESASRAELEKAFNDAGYATEPGTYDFKTIYDNYVKKNHKNPEALFDIIQFIKAEVANHHAKEKANGKDFDAATKTLMYKVKLRKPIPEGMTIEQLVEEMEENEDEVECKQCHELYDKSDCSYEIDLGWLCPQCEAAIKSRGETLTFREGPLEEAVANDFTWNKSPVELEYDKLGVTLQGVEKQSNDPYESPYHDEWDEDVSHTYEVDPITVAEFLWDVMTEEDVASVPGGFETLEDDAAFDSFMEEHFNALVEKYMDVILKKFEDDAIRDYEDKYDPYEVEANAKAGYWDNHRDDYFDESCATEQKTASMLEELEDSETYRKRLSLCPECGADSFDHETGICISCGFNILTEELDATDVKTLTDTLTKSLDPVEKKNRCFI